MSTQEIAHDLVALCKQGKFDEAGEKYWADDVVSVEAMGDMAESHGKQAARAKGEWWAGAHDVHGVEVEGPYVNGDEFAVRNSRYPDGPALIYTHAEVAALIEGVKMGEFDDLLGEAIF